MTRRVMSLWLPRFATDRIHRRRTPEGLRPARRGVGLVTAGAAAGRALVAAVDDAAAAEGLAPGMPLADARTLSPALRVHPADPAGDAAALDRLAAWCTRYTPWTAVETHDGGNGAGLWLDLTGCAHLFGGEAALLGDLLARLRRFGHAARAAVADSPGAAWAAARFIDDPRRTGIVMTAAETRDRLIPLPVAALRLPAATAAELHRLGLRRIGDLLPMPRAALARRFGSLPADRLDQALGLRAEPLSPRRPVAPHEARLVLAEPLLTVEAVAEGLRRLLGQLCRQLEAGQLGARRLVLTLYRVDGAVQQAAVGTSRPNREPQALARLFAEHLDTIDPGFGIDALALAAARVEPLAALQMRLARTPSSPRRQDAGLAALVDRLGNRLGFASLRRLVPRESYIPERAVASAPPLAPAKPGAGWPTLPPRPLRLFARPQPIEATALLPDHPPVMFRWHARLHRVRRAEGPERIAPEWWRPESGARPRDYFRVEDESGRRFWLCRDGQPPEGGRWYLHGLFG
ncbi:MAG: DNA polymerase Y family protein [Dongiaceae bacterium]